MKKRLFCLGIVATTMLGMTALTLTGCGEKKEGQDSTVVEECDTIALKQGHVIPLDSVAEYYQNLEFVKKDEARRIGAYMLALDTSRFAIEDWIVTLEAEYNSLGQSQNMPAVAPTREGTQALNKLIRKVQAFGENNATCQVEMNGWAAVCQNQEDFLDLYSMHAFKVMLHTEPAKYRAMIDMDENFNRWAQAQLGLFEDLNFCLGNVGSMYSMVYGYYSQYIYRLRPMTSFFSAISDPEFKLPAATTIDMPTAIPAEYKAMEEEVGTGTNCINEEPIDLKVSVRKACQAYEAYAKAADVFIKYLPEENQPALRQILGGKDRKIIISLKNRMQDAINGTSGLGENASDDQINKYHYPSTDYWKSEW